MPDQVVFLCYSVKSRAAPTFLERTRKSEGEGGGEGEGEGEGVRERERGRGRARKRERERVSRLGTASVFPWSRTPSTLKTRLVEHCTVQAMRTEGSYLYSFIQTRLKSLPST